MIGRFSKILCGIALTWSCAAAGLFLLHEFNQPWPCSVARIARLRAREIEMGIEQFQIENKRCPAGTAELIQGRYVSIHSLVDPWGRALLFWCKDDGPRALSAGPDREFGTADDVTDAY